MERKTRIPTIQETPKNLVGELKQKTQLAKDTGASLERQVEINVERVILRAKIRISRENITVKKP